MVNTWLPETGAHSKKQKQNTLCESHKAMEHGPFIDALPIKMVIVHSYVKFPKENNRCVEVAGLVTLALKLHQDTIYPSPILGP